MKLLEKHPTIIIMRGDNYSLNANITKKLTLLELDGLVRKHGARPKNELLYRELVSTRDACKTCGEPVKFVNFSQGYKDECKACTRKAAAITARATIDNTTGEIVLPIEVNRWIDYLKESGLAIDKWTQHTRAHNKNVWWTVKQSIDTKTWMEALYKWENPTISNNCKTCGKLTRFANYNEGYKTYCCATCARQDDELNARIGKAGSATKLKKSAEENTGKTSYCNYELYSNPVEANRKYINNYGMTLEEFDKVVPILHWCEATDYKQRYYYHINNIREQKVCHCGNKIDNYRHEHCSVGCVNRNEEVRSKIVTTNLEKYGVEHYSKTEERNARVEEANIAKFGVPHAAQSEECKDKAIATNIEKYGCEHPIGSTIIATGYQWKEYVYPSGKVIKVQGYEPQCLEDMVIEYGEDDLQFGTELEVQVKYTLNGTGRTYFPDGLVLSTNTIIEVKSEWTLGLGLQGGILEAKRQACLDAGYKFQLRVYDKNGSWYEYKFEGSR